jgi:phage protein D
MTPAARIALNGVDITANLIPAPFGLPLESGARVIPSGGLGTNEGPLLSISITDNEDRKSDSCELELDNRDYIPSPGKGSMLQVWLGYAETGVFDMGMYQVESWTKKGMPKTLTVSAKAAGLTTGIKAPKSRSYHQKSVSDIVQYIAGRNGLQAIVNGDVGGLMPGHLDQSSESDLNFLTRLAGRVGGKFKVANNTIIFNKGGSGMLPSGGAAPSFTLTPIGLIDWSCTGSARGEYGSVSVPWQNTQTGEREWVDEGEGTPKLRARKLFKTKDEAQAHAKATKGELARGNKKFNAEFPGDGQYFAGAQVEAVDFDPDVDDSYSIKAATHKLDSGGFVTSIDCELAGDGDANYWGD